MQPRAANTSEACRARLLVVRAVVAGVAEPRGKHIARLLSPVAHGVWVGVVKHHGLALDPQRLLGADGDARAEGLRGDHGQVRREARRVAEVRLQMRVWVELVVVGVDIWAVHQLWARAQELAGPRGHLTEEVKPVAVTNDSHGIPAARGGKGFNRTILAPQDLVEVAGVVDDGQELGLEDVEVLLHESCEGHLGGVPEGPRGSARESELVEVDLQW
mmetsp:Transcript_81429/g.242691  ORF Transcript_81429/g.242691 Transcript_81429/m.242691 type:complete len:217 (-) Transcript_81429:525-1175(-)